MRETNKILARNLRDRRRTLGFTQKQLAEMVGYSEKTVSKWESGLGLPPSTVLPDLAMALKTDINHLFQGAGEPMYYLGIDAGGTKTDFVLADKDGNLLNHITLKGCNPVDCGEKEAFRILNEGIYEVCDGIPFSQISAFAGIAGGGTGNYPGKIAKFMQGFRFAKVQNGNDAMNAIALGIGDADGIVVILGTGSVAFTKRSGEIIKTGGYGYLLGDKGSGFSIGRDALAAIFEMEEGYGRPTSLRERVLKESNTETVLKRLPEFYDGGKRKIASYAPVVFDAWEEGDLVARHILDENMQAVAELIINAGRRLPGTRDIPVTFIGGIAKREDIIIPLIKKHLDREEPSSLTRYQLTVCKEPVYMGALLMAGMKRKDG